MKLVCMRLTDMVKMHPEQDSSRVCAVCGQPVGIYPSGQAALKRCPDAEIECSVCAIQAYDTTSDWSIPAAPLDDIRQEMRDSYPVRKQ